MTDMLKKIFTLILFFLFPTGLIRPALNLMGHSVRSGAKVGFTFFWCDFFALDSDVRIGHLNFIGVSKLLIRKGGRVGHLNTVKGPFSLVLRERAALGNRNRILRARPGVSVGFSQLKLGAGAKITSDHRIDCTQSVLFGEHSILAGAGSQLWTHGYVHDVEGSGRYRIDGRIVIENNVYIGSACLISMGVRVAKGIIVGGGTSVATSLVEPGLYVSASIRRLSRPALPDHRDDLSRVVDKRLIEKKVYIKRRS
ncbi:hypothetical protein [Zoogloea sp.]|uniref:acyltransferase n=1 Tax=Zoogloea sp. TaxID=49181 RepID=UPI00262E8155|nr:hypothetical protein [Zoogloea sp.]MDD3352755.1 hypothetical protein [Zoogloea sp.]